MRAGKGPDCRGCSSGWLQVPVGVMALAGMGARDGRESRWFDRGLRSPAAFSRLSIAFLVEDWDCRCAWCAVVLPASDLGAR